jgi:hypothetical protein
MIAVSDSDCSVEVAYQQGLKALPVSERVARAAAMFQWTREQIARQIVAKSGPIDPEQLKWLVALRLYGNEPEVRGLIERKLNDVSS